MCDNATALAPFHPYPLDLFVAPKLGSWAFGVTKIAPQQLVYIQMTVFRKKHRTFIILRGYDRNQ
jgi:hypothetical protein